MGVTVGIGQGLTGLKALPLGVWAQSSDFPQSLPRGPATAQRRAVRIEPPPTWPRGPRQGWAGSVGPGDGALTAGPGRGHCCVSAGPVTLAQPSRGKAGCGGPAGNSRSSPRNPRPCVGVRPGSPCWEAQPAPRGAQGFPSAGRNGRRAGLTLEVLTRGLSPRPASLCAGLRGCRVTVGHGPRGWNLCASESAAGLEPRGARPSLGSERGRASAAERVLEESLPLAGPSGPEGV